MPSPSHLSTIYSTNSSTILYKLVFQIIKYMDLNPQIGSIKTFIENSKISPSRAKSYHQIKSNQI